MAATIGLHVYTGANAASESSIVTGIDFVSTDNAVNSPGNRTSWPVVTGTNSFSKHIRLKIESIPPNSVSNFKFWTDGTATANVLLKAQGTGTAVGTGSGGATPGSGDSTPSATALSTSIDAYSLTSSNKGTWDSGSYSTINHVTKSLVLQLQPNSSAAPGNWSETFSYSYDEA